MKTAVRLWQPCAPAIGENSKYVYIAGMKESGILLDQLLILKRMVAGF
jgi:hypothetical protein